jgi:hypothetical protein
MGDPELVNHKLFNNFPEGWAVRAIGPVLFICSTKRKILIEQYAYLCVQILEIGHNHDIEIIMEEHHETEWAIVVIKIQADNGKKNINACYNICCMIDNMFEELNV